MASFLPFRQIIRRFSSSQLFSELSENVLIKNGFTKNQAKKIVTSLEPYLKENTHETIDRSLACWRKNIVTNKNDHSRNETLFKEVFFHKETRLLLIDEDFILNRIENLKSLDLVRGVNDLWHVFVKSPTGYYLQDWTEFLKKYYFITYKVLPWFVDSKKTDQMHPLVSCPEVMEQSYEHIKTRFIFVNRTGIRQATENKKLNVFNLFLVPLNVYLKIFAPFCTEEEFQALEKLNSTLLGEEDDQLFEDLVQLAPKQNLIKKKEFMDKSLSESLVLSNLNF